MPKFLVPFLKIKSRPQRRTARFFSIDRLAGHHGNQNDPPEGWLADYSLILFSSNFPFLVRIKM